MPYGNFRISKRNKGVKIERILICVKKVIFDWSREALIMKKPAKIIGVVFLSCGSCMISPVFGARENVTTLTYKHSS